MNASTQQQTTTVEIHPSNAIDVHSSEKCHHCGNTCEDENITLENKLFCCEGCKTVYEILQAHQLCDYYSFDERKIASLKNAPSQTQFEYLSNPDIAQRLLSFTDGKTSQVSFYIPAIHCSSCIYLLEHLYKLDTGVLHSQTDFLRKTVKITFQEGKTTLKSLAVLLSKLGYAPHITLEDSEKQHIKRRNSFTKEQKQLVARVAVAGFCFGNMMLISFPEYFGFDSQSVGTFRHIFSLANIVLALPVFFYSGWVYLSSAYKSLRKGILNIDFPLALGMVVLLVRSVFEILTDSGAGYLDTLAGLVFFLLIGRWFQQKTFDTLRYDRDFKAYFPIAVTIKKLISDDFITSKILDLSNNPTQKVEHEEKQILATDLKKGDRILIRHQELIPADSLLIEGEANIDYSFVTGEAVPVHKKAGEVVYAGGRQIGKRIELEVLKPVSQSHLTSLWNHESFQGYSSHKKEIKTFQTFLSQYFTIGLLIVAFGSGIFWGAANDWTKAVNAFSAVLIIACPCALALSSPFALGTAMRILGGMKFYLKNTQVIEILAKANAFVFDKTGTITQNNEVGLTFKGELNSTEKSFIKSLTKNSLHPLSTSITEKLGKIPTLTVLQFKEEMGKGLEGEIEGVIVKIGSEKFVREGLIEDKIKSTTNTTKVHVSFNHQYKGYFEFQNAYRQGVKQMIAELQRNHTPSLHLLSGDNESEKENLKLFFGEDSILQFHQTPHDKLQYISNLQQKGNTVVMLGDGLNDAGALQQSNAGIAITENTSYFTPAADAIMEASVLNYLPDFVSFCKKTMGVLKMSFVISLIYNLIGLYFAVQGTLSPLIAAILMPISSVTIIAFTTLTVSQLKTGRTVISNQ
jgi:Cu+-exporting ATPase